MKRTRKTLTKLAGRTRILASKYIAEEFAIHKYPPAQARAIGISRAKAEVQKKSQKRH